MGLDIYFHKTTIPFEGDESNIKDFSAFTDKVDALAQKTLGEKLNKLLEPLREAWEKMQTNEYWRNTYNERYFAFVQKLRPLIATNYEFKIYPFTNKILDLPELEEKVKKEIEGAYEEYDAYFRKVNFLFHYFDRTISKMHDQYYAFVEPEDVDDIIDRCERVLKNHDLAHSLLPTQDGFFFGSTDYDNWYFSDVKDCLKQMKKYRKLLKDGVTGYVIFSW
jgi:hypothetical protein